ncbi:S8 family peptidase [Geothrix alkalitolerans]|uniref:S8 family peptidase n=1 Tax=Geothrix alkalitolerans TaxID=2922724 RepID=UPI001FAF9D77|nr:S8 family peptidase [Geothrix alkalitolerans]
MAEVFPHLRIDREQPITEKRPGRGPRVTPPADIKGHACQLQISYSKALAASKKNIQGFDERPLFKLQVGTLQPEIIEQGFPGVEVVSQEDGGHVLAFASQSALADFEARLATMAAGDTPKYAQILYALNAFDCWTEEDRKGWALKNEGLPSTAEFRLDIELWPINSASDRQSMLNSFQTWALQNGMKILDSINHESLILYRVECNINQATLLLNHRDIRTVDLLPLYGMAIEAISTDLQDIPDPLPPPENAPFIAVLDSGIAGGHPLLKSALADAQGFLDPDRDAHDEAGHGTHVAGIALYGDIEECWRSKSFSPELWLLSGRILDDKAEANTRLIENVIEEAVRYFYDNYGCKIFNLAYGDANKPYHGGHVRGVAYTLDRLSRELGILFIVPTGNYEDVPISHLRGNYPDYLLEPSARLIDPAPALNVLTIGSLARWDETFNSSRWPNDPHERPIARHDQISPFSRCGTSVRDAIKPELVAYGGNWALHLTTNRIKEKGLGELSTSGDFATGRVLSEKPGTSFAVPHVAHVATKLLGNMPPGTSTNLIKALLIANARIPHACKLLFSSDEDILSRTVGYGVIESSGLFRSTEDEVTLISEAELENKSNHFYEVPLPKSFYGEGRRSRTREITIALAHCPPTRTTRVNYKAIRMEFKLVEANNLAEAVKMFNKSTPIDEYNRIPEVSCNKMCYGSQKRSKGTAQCTTWMIKRSRPKSMFIVVTRNDNSWADCENKEPYALAIKIFDRENEEAKLYTQIRTVLQLRERAKVRI